MEIPEAYLPIDRCLAIATGQTLPDRTRGAALFADISGFTTLTEALAQALGAERGAEELTQQLNRVYGGLIEEVYGYGGTVISFSGDAITCWFDHDSGCRATACAMALQQAMARIGNVGLPTGALVTLGLKVAVTSGPVRRFVVGNPEIQLMDVLAGALLDELASAEHHAVKGEVVVSEEVAAALDGYLTIREWRSDPERGAHFAVVGSLLRPVGRQPWPAQPQQVLNAHQLRSWLLPPVYERLRSGLGGFLTELRPVTVVFISFRGIEYDDDRDAGHKLDGYIRWVQGIVLRHGGFLMQLTMGDKGSYLTIAFGAPIAHGDDASRALAAALELREVPEELGFIQQVQIGISQGRVRTGAYGSLNRRTYSVIGDEVNIAARLMQHAPAGQVLVSRTVHQAALNQFAWTAMPPLLVKGKAKPLTVFRLNGPQAQRHARLHEPHYALPLVGRQADLALVRERLQQVQAGQPQIVGITGEAGMGKSRFVAEAIGLASQQGLSVHIGECQSYGTHRSYLVWHNIWHTFFDLDPAASLEEQIRTLEAQLRAINPTLVARLPLLGRALNLPIPDNELTRSLDAKLRKTALEGLLIDCVRERARTTPLLFVLEDCHWIDPLSDDLLEALGRALMDVPVLLVVAYRPPDLKRAQGLAVLELPWCTVIRLTEFTPAEAEQLIRLKLEQLLGPGVAVPEELLRSITERAQGNPFYIEELVNYLRDRGIDPQDSRTLERLDLPDSLHSLILSRIDQLSESQKIVLKVASVIGRTFRVSWLWGAHAELGEQPRVQTDLERLSQLDLTPLDQPEPEPVFMFKHIVTREVAYESLPYAMRAQLHGQLGAFLESSYADTLEQYVDLLAYHYEHSGITSKQREYLRKAGERAQSAYANAAAIDYYRRLLPLLEDAERVDVTLKLGHVLELVGEWAEAGQRYQDALELARQVGDPRAQASCESALGDLFRKQGAYADAQAWLERARAAFQAAGDWAGVGHVLKTAGTVAAQQGDLDAARAMYAQSLEILREQGDQAGIANTLNDDGIVAMFQGDLAAACARIEGGLAIRRQLADKLGIANSLNNLGLVASDQGELTRARELYTEALAIQREVGNKAETANLLNNLGTVAERQMDYTAARHFLEDSLSLRRQLGDKQGVATSFYNLGRVAAQQGDTAGAYALLCEGLVICQELGDRLRMAELLQEIAVLAASDSQAEAALCLASAVLSLRESIGAPLAPHEQERFEHRLTPARQALGAAATAAAHQKGKAMTLEEAIAEALAMSFAA